MPFPSYGDFSFFGVALAKLFANRPALERRGVHENTISIGHKAMALARWGVEWLPLELVRPELDEETLVFATEDPAWSLLIEVRLYRHARPTRPIVDRFRDAARAYGPVVRS